MEQVILRKILEHVPSKSYEIYLYGSSALDLLSGRDIDTISISPYFDIVKWIELDVSITDSTRKCNLYLVPEKVFCDDVFSLKYGGYYSHKFALSFKLLSKNGKSTNAPSIFWLQELLFCKANEPNTLSIAPEMLSKFVHRQILQFHPEFIRPLSKYIMNKQAQQQLLDYIKYKILLSENLQAALQQSDYEIFFDNAEKSSYRFWKEYNTHKCKSNIWGNKTYKKKILSCENVNLDIIQEYFEAS